MFGLQPNTCRPAADKTKLPDGRERKTSSVPRVQNINSPESFGERADFSFLSPFFLRSLLHAVRCNPLSERLEKDNLPYIANVFYLFRRQKDVDIFLDNTRNKFVGFQLRG